MPSQNAIAIPFVPPTNPIKSPIFNITVLLSSFIGNGLEFYDFVLCGVLIPQLAPLFFPSIHPLSSLLAGMAAYAVGFLMRPIGGILFGHIGDKWGRRRALTLSVIGMAFSTFLFALLPTYEQIGIVGGVLFVLLRLCQGLCLGGEVVGSALFCLEHHATKYRGFLGGIIAAGAMGGAFLASLVSYFLTTSSLFSQGWRIAFALGAVTGLVGFYIRKHLPETLEYKESLEVQKERASFPLLTSFKNHPYRFLEVFSYASIAGALAATVMVFLNTYYTQVLSFTPSEALKLTSIGTFTAIFLHPLAGLVADKIGARNSMKLFCLFTAYLALPAYVLLATNSYPFILIGVFVIVVSYSGIAATGYAFAVECFPVQYRYSSYAVSYNVAQALLGGTQPLICLFLMKVTGSVFAPALYLAFLSIFCVIVISVPKSPKALP